MCTAAIGFCGNVQTCSRETGGVGEIQVAEFNLAEGLGANRNFRVTVVNIRFGSEDVIQTAHGSRATLKNIRDPPESNHGPNEQGEIAVEGHQRAEGNLAAEELMAALPQNDKETCAHE